MLIQECSKGQRVHHKESGKIATVLSVSHNKGEILIAFDNASRLKVQAHSLEPAQGEPPPQAESGGPMRPCPQCATQMPLDATVCPSCGFEYGVKKRGGLGGLIKAFVILIILVAIGYAVWKYVLPR